jgi:hypothetical protein
MPPFSLAQPLHAYLTDELVFFMLYDQDKRDGAI